MTRIPDAVSLLSQATAVGRSTDPQQAALRNVLLAAILHAEDECLVLTESELRAAQSYSLVVTVIPEDDAVVLTVRPK